MGRLIARPERTQAAMTDSDDRPAVRDHNSHARNWSIDGTLP